ncbi:MULTISPECIES: queuosine precursor transporter [unclassified Kocuria]|uniref:queuosine precursor transporter n=1 Tax=unclassified Kocuria TaxID=2649579 RepID=UPI000F87CB4D|nr:MULTISPECIES: queuosine precursor transporter [unclassified Kocuria]RUP85091.1 VUT family protein [Kocuria sp. HSID17590]RUQ12219.1 VUT family protein [Kocuria sp. HSID17582]
MSSHATPPRPSAAAPHAVASPSGDDPAAPRPARGAAFASRPRTYFDLVLAGYCVILVLSNIGATKGVQFGPVITDGGFFLFPLAYVLGDVVSEVYGFRAARRAILTSFFFGAFSSLVFWIVIALPAAPFYENQSAFEAVLGPVPLIVAGSLLGYLVGQLLNAYVMVKVKERTSEKHLWARLISSTLVGELVDTLIFCAVAAPVIGIDSWSAFANYAVVGYVYKCLVEVVIMPVTYAAIAWIKRREPGYAQAATNQG